MSVREVHLGTTLSNFARYVTDLERIRDAAAELVAAEANGTPTQRYAAVGRLEKVVRDAFRYHASDFTVRVVEDVPT